MRAYVVGDSQRAATADELAQMKTLVAQAMEQGALGLSTSLQYVPDRFASTDEIVELAKVAAKYGGIYISHQRSESAQIMTSLDEAFTIAERASIPAEVWHLKTAYKANWGRMADVLKHFEEARARGLDVTANMYPYDRASNGLDACLPLWVREGGLEPMLKRLQDPSMRDRIKRDMNDANAKDWENQWYGSGGGDGVMLSSVLDPSLRKWEGKTLAEIGKAMGKDPRDAVMDLVIADRGESSVIISIMREDDVRLALANPLISIGTDSGAKAEDGPLSESKSHPRAWGSFPRILGKYVRDEKLITLEAAIRRFTSRPAIRVGLTDRGVLRPGMKADITVFDPATIHDVSTFIEPTHYSVGVQHVLVNGKAVVSGGKITAERPGEALRGPGRVDPDCPDCGSGSRDTIPAGEPMTSTARVLAISLVLTSFGAGVAAAQMTHRAQALTVALGPDIPAATRVVAGGMALLAQQANLARTLFDMVAKADPKNGRAQTGLASAALMVRDWESAGKVPWNARDLAPKDQRPALAAAIGDLQQIARIQ